MGRTGFRRPQRKYSPIGLNVRDRRVRLGLTQAGLAARSGLAIPHINMIEGGERRNLRAQTLKSLAEALECSIDDLTAEPNSTSFEASNEVVPEALHRFLMSVAGENVQPQEIEQLKGAERFLGFPPTVGTYLRLLDLLRSESR